MSDSVRPHRRQPTRLSRPWDSPGNNTGVGCHFLLWCMKVKRESEVAQSCLTLSNPMDCSLPGSSVHGIFQARVLEWGAIALHAFKYVSLCLYSTLLLFSHFWIGARGQQKCHSNDTVSFVILCSPYPVMIFFCWIKMIAYSFLCPWDLTLILKRQSSLYYK